MLGVRAPVRLRPWGGTDGGRADRAWSPALLADRTAW